MKIVLGADLAMAVGGSPAVELLKRLRFNGAQTDVVHVVPPPIYTGWEYDPVIAPSVLADIAQQDRESAREAMEKVVADVGAGLGAKAVVAMGNPTERLMVHADETHADLIAINGTVAGPLVAFLTGSVARGLVIGAHQSVLLARGKSEELRPLRAVLATDHSPYSERCMAQLTQLWPQGIQHITVLTSYPEDRIRAMEPMLPQMAVEPSQAVRETLEAKNTALIEKLSGCFHPMLTTFESRISPLPVHDAIAEAMKESASELLILGAHGHSFLERLTMGSTSFRESVFSPYSVLVMRA
ncbi:universal stress protein [Armatimonas sp.]|uniref:universal stress protein n=1 Tax=Armatimonas sp. TaxID=1872638 RepID=UPI0037504602